MKAESKRLAACSMTAALCVVLMWLGFVLEIGIYLSPIVSGFLLIPVRKQYGYKYLVAVLAASGLLSLILVPNAEQNLLYIGLFGWYPALRNHLHKLTALPAIAAKLVIFNAIVLLVETLVINVLAPEVIPSWMAGLLLVFANIAFLLYDYLLPRIEMLLGRFSKFY